MLPPMGICYRPTNWISIWGRSSVLPDPVCLQETSPEFLGNLVPWTACQRSPVARHVWWWGQLSLESLAVPVLGMNSPSWEFLPCYRSNWTWRRDFTLCFDIRGNKELWGSEIMDKGYETSSSHNPGIWGVMLSTGHLQERPKQDRHQVADGFRARPQLHKEGG